MVCAGAYFFTNKLKGGPLSRQVCTESAGAFLFHIIRGPEMRKLEGKVVNPLAHFLCTHFADVSSYLYVNISLGLLNLKMFYIGSSFKNGLRSLVENLKNETWNKLKEGKEKNKSFLWVSCRNGNHTSR